MLTVKGGIIFMSMGGLVVLWGDHIFSESQKGGGVTFFSRFSKACDISIKRADSGTR